MPGRTLGSLGIPGASLGTPWVVLGGSLDVPGMPLGVPGGSLGGPSQLRHRLGNYDAGAQGPPSRYCKQYLKQITRYW